MAGEHDHPVVTVPVAAAMCGVSRRTVGRWIDEGKLPAHRVKGVQWVSVLDIEEAMGEALGRSTDPR